ncbi:hypothetical protein FRC07_009248 [Ceratobasidium sp. 392]|nr:hypothetical protein FRC07_009248 [Ceratobasidium sp. 392]
MYLGRVLQMTTSLRRLSLDCLDYNSSEADDICCFFGRLFIDEIRRRAHDPLFLPRLSVLESPATPSLLRICRGRPVESISHIRDSDPATNPLLTHLHPLGASQSRLSVSIVVPTGLEQYRVNAMGAFSTLYTAAIEDWVIKHLKITVVGPRDQSSVPTEAGCPAYWAGIISDFSAHLESLRIEFDPPLAENSMKRQRLAIKAAARHIPSLAYAVVGSSDVEWGKRVEKQPNSTSRIPDWTPRPNRGGWKVLSWWLRRSGVDSSKATKADVPVLLMRIRNIMLTRWDDDSVPSVGDLRRRIKFDAITN